MTRLTAPAHPRDAGKDAGATRDAAPVAQASPPASPSKHAARHLRDSINKGNGVLQNQILAALMGVTREEPLTTARIHGLCPAAASRDSVSVTLRTLQSRGLVECDSRVEDARRANVYWLAGPAALNDGHEANIAAVRRLVADEEPGPEPEPEPTPLPDDADEAIAQSMIDHTRAKLLSECGRAQIGFAYDDGGALEIRTGEETLRLAPPTVARLVRFLGRIAA